VVSVEESCIYTMTPDENPVIDTVPGKENVVIGVGFSGDVKFDCSLPNLRLVGTGFKLGPVTGNMLADMAMGIKTRQEVDLLSINRFLAGKSNL
jgi:glycine/D-amino acid oxidase-like deaminating enzyme